MNNAITNIKITLEGINSRITEVGEKISGVEDRMVEINEAGRKKEKTFLQQLKMEYILCEIYFCLY